jgi:glycogen synthase
MAAAITRFPGGPKRLLMTTDAVGGVWTYSLELIRALAPYDVEIALVILGPKPTAAQMISAERLPNCRVLQRGRALEWMEDPWEDVDAVGQWLMDVAEDFAPDVVHLNDYSHAVLPWRCPVVVVAHSCVLTWWRSVKAEAAPARYEEYRRRVEAGLLAASAVVTPTAAYRKQITKEYGLHTPAEIIPNARATQAFAPRAKEPRILSAGRLWDEGKNLQLLDRIAPEVSWEIALAGETELQNAVAFSGRRLRRLGRLDEPALAHVFGAAEIYAAPAYYEPFGLAILEAALCGCALVLSDIPTLRENWQTCALFVHPDDDRGWVHALNELAENPLERKWLQTRARQRALTFSPARQAQSYVELYRTLMERPADVSTHIACA